MTIVQLRLTSFDAVPEHMKQLSAIAQSKGLSCAAYLRFMIARECRRAAKAASVK